MTLYFSRQQYLIIILHVLLGGNPIQYKNYKILLLA